MQHVTAQGTDFYYFAPSEALDREQLPLDARAPDPALVARLSSDGARLALFVNMLDRRRGNFYFLSWPRELDVDLTALDRRVSDGSYTDADFVPAAKTVYQDTVCDSCARTWPTLVIPPGDPYPGAPHLLAEKIAAAKTERCPACGTPFRQTVVKILGQPRGA